MIYICLIVSLRVKLTNKIYSLKMINTPNPRQNFYELEQAILKFWKDNDILNKSINQRDDLKSKTFYDGPITANGSPHHGHMLTFAMKDIYPRYWTMNGFKVSRSLGWDCQGLPVEYEVEKKLGFKEKKDIEKFGIAKFNELCRNSVLEFKDKIIELEELMGRLTNNEEEYHTMDKDFIESIWWSLSELYKKGLLYEGFKVVPYSTRAGTTLSNAEVALGGYKKFIDPAITVEFPLVDDPKTSVLAWTTTPWTIPGNLGLAVGLKIKYAKVLDRTKNKNFIVAFDLIGKIFEGVDYEVIEEINSSDLIGQSYIPPFNFYLERKNAHKIIDGEHVTTETGTGIVHLAPYGAEDNEIFQRIGVESFDYLDDQGDFKNDISQYAGLNYKDANLKIVEDLKNLSRLFKFEQYEHEMPMCWRTNTPLIYKPITSWYIGMSRLRKELVENNNKINWTPKHVKEGRFGNWIAEIKDWGISRTRYWGTPIPVWKSESGKVKVIGSYAELKDLSGLDVSDPHRPYIDDITFEFQGETYRRIPDVLDVWYDSGSMPFARFHYPFENKEKFEKNFPAQYIAESVDQTRGWFYSLHAISTALFNKETFENVVMSGFVLDDNGSKLSKSKGNYTEPIAMIEAFGADVIRMNFFSTPICAGEDTTISTKTLKIQTQEFLLPLWNIYTYLVTYANINQWSPREELAYNLRKNFDDIHPWDHIPFDTIDSELDRWILARLQQTINETKSNLDSFNIQTATRSIKNFITDISKWYIRRSRDRFASGEIRPIEVLYYVLIETLKLTAPLAPFVTEHIYKELTQGAGISSLPESIHLCEYPEFDSRFFEENNLILEEMSFVQRICELGQTLRTVNNLKLRQPLSDILIISKNDKITTLPYWMKDIISGELNVKNVFESLDKNNANEYKYEEDSNLKIILGLNTKIDPALADEGTIREFTRIIQSLRKKLGFKQGENLIISYSTSNNLISSLIEKNKTDLMHTLSARDLILNTGISDGQSIKLNDEEIIISLQK